MFHLYLSSNTFVSKYILPQIHLYSNTFYLKCIHAQLIHLALTAQKSVHALLTAHPGKPQQILLHQILTLNPPR